MLIHITIYLLDPESNKTMPVFHKVMAAVCAIVPYILTLIMMNIILRYSYEAGTIFRSQDFCSGLEKTCFHSPSPYC
jgi:hypothetical protein